MTLDVLVPILEKDIRNLLFTTKCNLSLGSNQSPSQCVSGALFADVNVSKATKLVHHTSLLPCLRDRGANAQGEILPFHLFHSIQFTPINFAVNFFT